MNFAGFARALENTAFHAKSWSTGASFLEAMLSNRELKVYSDKLSKIAMRSFLVRVRSLQNKWRGRATVRQRILDSVYASRLQQWESDMKLWAVIKLQTWTRMILARAHTHIRVCERFVKFQVNQIVERDEEDLAQHGGPKHFSHPCVYWYDKGRPGKASSKSLCKPPLLCRLGDVPTIPVPDIHTEFKPYCMHCDDREAPRAPVAVKCHTCEEVFCHLCFEERHLRGASEKHESSLLRSGIHS